MWLVFGRGVCVCMGNSGKMGFVSRLQGKCVSIISEERQKLPSNPFLTLFRPQHEITFPRKAPSSTKLHGFLYIIGTKTFVRRLFAMVNSVHCIDMNRRMSYLWGIVLFKYKTIKVEKRVKKWTTTLEYWRVVTPYVGFFIGDGIFRSGIRNWLQKRLIAVRDGSETKNCLQKR